LPVEYALVLMDQSSERDGEDFRNIRAECINEFYEYLNINVSSSLSPYFKEGLGRESTTGFPSILNQSYEHWTI
jgi:hypothetical protein